MRTRPADAYPSEAPGDPRTEPGIWDTSSDPMQRARQAMLHGGGGRPSATPIPSAYRPGGMRRVNHELPADAIAEPRPQQPPGAALDSEASPPYDEGMAPLSEGDSLPYEAQDPAMEDAGNSPSWDHGDWETEGFDDEFQGLDEGTCGESPCCWDSCGRWCSSTFCGGNTSAWLGVQGFKGAGNQARDGSFGFQQGVNFGTPLPIVPESGIGWQVGFRTIQANIEAASFSGDQRNQTFFTTGFFRRVPVGFQTGFVFDLLKDKWYSDINVGQVRAEFSWKFPCRHEWGYWFAAGDSSDSTASPITPGVTDIWNPKEINAFFYRRRLSWLEGGTSRFYAGFGGNGDGLIGADSRLPFHDSWLIQSSFTYLVPNESSRALANLNESWNVSLALVWTFGGHCETAFAPLFDVADNGSFFLDRSN